MQHEIPHTVRDRCYESLVSGQTGILTQDCVCSTLFSVQRRHILIFFPKSETQILNSLQVTVKTNLLAELKHQAPN